VQSTCTLRIRSGCISGTAVWAGVRGLGAEGYLIEGWVLGCPAGVWCAAAVRWSYWHAGWAFGRHHSIVYLALLLLVALFLLLSAVAA
jgi:hypothetical protein